jgi:hypothetical protein
MVKWVQRKACTRRILAMEIYSTNKAKEKFLASLETFYLSSIPGMTESIIEAKALSLNAFTAELDWRDPPPSE